MKYVRTENGIYEFKNNMSIENDCLFGKFEKSNKKHLFINYKDLGEVIKQADTIEELCDEYVLYDNQLDTYRVFDKKVISYKWLQNHINIYKGMTIYVLSILAKA